MHYSDHEQRKLDQASGAAMDRRVGGKDVVGHKTFDTGERDENGMPKLRHEPLTRAEGEALWNAAKEAERARAVLMPDEKAAINHMWDGWCRLKELGWREAQYCPKDGTHFQAIEPGSTGIHDCNYQGEWASGSYWLYGDGDIWPSRPILFKLYPEDQVKYDTKMAEAKARYHAVAAPAEPSSETPMERSTGNRKYLREEDCEDNDEGA